MKRIEFEFNGRYYFLAMTAEALFTVYDQFGYTTDILATTGCLEPTVDGYKNLCWMAALLASQGELQRRRMGYSAQEMLAADDLRTNLPPTKVAELQDAVVEAMQEGFRRETEPEEEQEINLVLRERDEAEKKKAGYTGRSGYLAAAAYLCHYAPCDALLLTPGQWADIRQLLTPAKEATDDGRP